MENNYIIQAWDWFINEESGGLHTAFMSIKRHPDLRDIIVAMILQFARFNFVEVFTNGMKKALPDLRDLVSTIELIFKPLSEQKFAKDEV